MNPNIKSKYIAALLPVFLAACSSTPQLIQMSDLPAWSGDTTTLTWLNPERNRGTSDIIPPPIRLGTKVEDSVLYQYSLGRDLTPGGLPLPNNWSITGENHSGCLNKRYTLNNSKTNQHIILDVQQGRNDGFISRRLGCLGGSAMIYSAIATNDRYLAFDSSEPGWRFFDMSEGTVLPFVVHESGIPNIFRTSDGEILIEPEISKNATQDVKNANPIRRVMWQGKPLKGTVSPTLATEVQAMNNAHDCETGRKKYVECRATNSFNNIPVPPDPGPAFEDTIEGIDTDNNGIRDDLDRYLALQFGRDARRYQAAKSMAKSAQKLLMTDPSDLAAVKASLSQFADNRACLTQSYKAETGMDPEFLMNVVALTIIPPIRMIRWREIIVASGVNDGGASTAHCNQDTK